MCTVTLLMESREFILTMNRDEQRSRAPEIPPEQHASGVLYPIDGAAGGTWIGVNQHGVAACLLNHYVAAASLPKTEFPLKSRGLIIPELLAKGNGEACLSFLTGAFNPQEYSPFFLIIVTESGAFEAAWNGTNPFRLEPLDTSNGPIMRTSSSWNSEAVCAWRVERFEAWNAESNVPNRRVLDFHRLQEPGKKEWSPLMSRTETATRSITQLHVSFLQSRAELLYWPEPHAQHQFPQRKFVSMISPVEPSGPSPLHPHIASEFA